MIAVLKDERRDLLNDAQGLFKTEKSVSYRYGQLERQCWDIEHFTSWSRMDRPVRVVRSLETKYRRRQNSGKLHYETSEWFWVSTHLKRKASHGRLC